MQYPPIPQRKACDCSDPCISTDDVYYAGPNLPNSGINTYNVLTEVIEKLDAIYAVPTLQRVTEMGNYTTLPIIADSFVKIGGDGTNLLLDNGTVLPIGDLPAGVTETSQLINDGEDGINPFITALDIPAFNPSDYDLDEFTNLNADPFAHLSDIPAPLGYVPVNKAGDTMLGDLILNEDPSTALGAATKQYVDNIVTGINFHAPVVVATDVSLVATYDNGIAGVGATLTGPSVGVLMIDGETPTYLQRILVWQQADPIQNGVYDLTTVGDSVTVYQLTRSSDADNSPPGEIHYGDYTLVLSGDTNGGFGFICNTPGTIDIGITPITYIQFNAAQAVTAGYGLQEAVSNVISIDPLVTQEKITLTTTGSGAATLDNLTNTLNIPQADNYWTKTGDDIQNNNIGNTKVKLLSGKQFQLLNSANSIVGYIDETGIGKFGAGSTYTSFGPASANVHLNMVRTQMSANFTLGNPVISQPYSLISTNYFGTSYVAGSAEVSASAVAEHSFNIGNSVGNGITSGIFRISRTRVQSTVPVKYATDLSASYDDRTLVDKGYITTYTTAQLAGKMNIPSLTASYIPKALTATTIGNSRLLDTGTYLGIGTVDTPTKDITLGNQGNKVLGIEQSSNTVDGRTLSIEAGRTINFVPTTDFISINQNFLFNAMYVALNGDVWGYSNNIYKQTAGVGDFVNQSVNTFGISSVSLAPNGNVYASVIGGGIYMQTNGTGAFNSLGQTIRNWRGITVAPNGDVYACVFGGDIYKQTTGTGDFIALNQISRNWVGMDSASNGDIYVAVQGDQIYKQSLGTGNFNAIAGSPTGSWRTLVVTSTNDVLIGVYDGYGSIYKQTGGIGSFAPLPNSVNAWQSMAIAPNGNIYASGLIGGVYVQQNNGPGSSNLNGGTLSLNAGTGKGTGASDIELYTGQVLASGTDMQTSTLRAKINNTGLMTLPSVTNALIEADTTGKAVVTKEYVNNRLVVETASPYTLTNADSGGIVIFTASATLTIPTGLADGFECTFVTLAGATLTVVSTGNTLNNASGSTMAAGLSFTLKRMLTTNIYIVTGDL